MTKALVTGLILICSCLGGCSPQAYEDIEVITATHPTPAETTDGPIIELTPENDIASPPSKTQDLIVVPAEQETSATTNDIHINIKADNARIQDLVDKIARLYDLRVRWEVDPGNAHVTVNLNYVKIIPALRVVLDTVYLSLYETNGTLFIREAKSRT